MISSNKISAQFIFCDGKKIVKIAKTMTTDKKQIFDQKSSLGPSAYIS